MSVLSNTALLCKKKWFQIPPCCMIFRISRTSKTQMLKTKKQFNDKGKCQNTIKLNLPKYKNVSAESNFVRNSFPQCLPVAPLESLWHFPHSQVHPKSIQVTVAPEILGREKQRELQIHTLVRKKRINNKYERKLKYFISLHRKDCNQMLNFYRSHSRITIFITNIKVD